MSRVALLLLTWVLCSPTLASPLTDAIERLERLGFEAPDAALQGLNELSVSATQDVFQVRVAQGLNYAASGRAKEARAAADALQGLDPALHGNTGLIAADMILAELAESEAKSDQAALHAQAGLSKLQVSCAPKRPNCDHRTLWRLQMLASAAADERGLEDEAERMAQEALWTAKTSKDEYRQARALLMQVGLASRKNRLDTAEELLAQARQLAERSQEPSLMVRVIIATVSLPNGRRDRARAVASLRQALALARSSGLVRQTIVALIWLSDTHVKAGHPELALHALQQAQRELVKLKDKGQESTVLHNMGLAKLQLGDIAAGKRDIEAGLRLLDDTGGTDEIAESLREYSEALANIGDISGALTAYHRERKLKSEAMAANREATLSDLHSRFNKAAQQREIELQSRENAVQKAMLDNHSAQQKLWAWMALVTALVIATLGLMVRRMRQTQRLLRRRQDDLRVQSEQDSLTGLDNRRSLHRSIQAAKGNEGEYRGGLLLIDLDHFKRINDVHGHSAGDMVLKEVAQRLKALVEDGDVVGRWGGEEFAIHLPLASPARTADVASAVLKAIGGQPIPLPSGPLRVTASVGFGTYPLPQAALMVAWEQALNLADMVLYQAKSQGRNRAVGLVGVQADRREELADIEADFESATHRGWVQLQTIPGPEAHNAGHATV